ncbi:MAG: tRNA lysidine(34) synthetase TilS [Clostridia bacterium]|nr:tRNA lysidine(34) synthetase TilS [Clostridia bacterium]
MNILEKKIEKAIKQYNLIEEGDKIVLAVSGGPDSIAMLNAMYNLKKVAKRDRPFWQQLEKNGKSCQKGLSLLATFDIVVAHVNHMIRKEAGEDEKFVKEYCQKIGVEFYSKSIDVKKLANNNKIGLEEAGRIARYEFFDEVAKKTNSNKIAIAHNQNDKVETIIMHALRGSGTYGLQGIQAINGKYIRPLIECNREEIENYCKENNIEARIDKTNFENEYTRNKIRNVVIPYIKQEFNPNIINTITRLGDLIKEENDYIEIETCKAYANIVLEENENEIILNLKQFNNQEKVIKSRLVLYIINRLFGTSKGIEKIHIEDILKLCQNNIGNKYLTPNKNTKVFVKSRKSTLYKNLKF